MDSPPRQPGRRWLAVLVLVVGVLLAAAPAARTALPAAAAGDPRFFAQTGYSIDNDAFYDYFQHRGGLRNFGYPISEIFTLQGFRVQFFQRQVMQLRPDGTVGLLNLLDPGILPYTKFNGSTFPAVDPSLVGGAPKPDSPTYNQDALAFVAAHAPDTFNGRPVNFHARFLATVTAADAAPNGGGNPALLPLFDLEIWGLPTSAPASDPANGNFVYLRFQRGIMQFDATTGQTQGVLLGDYLKETITGANLPPDLSQEAAPSPLFEQWAPGQPQFLARPAALPNTDLTNAFYQQTPGGQPIVPTATPLPPPTATPIGDFCIGDERMTFAGTGNVNIGDTVYITVTSARNHSNVVLTGTDGPTFIKQYQGQEGQVWQYQVTMKSAGRHYYTYYVDTTVPCTANYFDVAGPTSTPLPTSTAGVATGTPTATPTVGPKPVISSVNPTTFVDGQVITVNGGPFGLPPSGSGASGTNGSVFFFFQPGAPPTAGPGTPTATPLSGTTSSTGSIQNWQNTFISVQVPILTSSAGSNGSYCVQVTVNGAPPSDALCGLQVSG